MTELICIICPKGCHLKVDESEDYAVTGAGCKRGIEYGRKELTNPTRVITSTVKINGGIYRRLPVKLDAPIAKSMIFDVVKLLDSIEVTAPIHSGDIICPNVLGTGVHFIACRDM